MRYVSTRGGAPGLGFEDVLLTGLARDGGLYMPAEWPVLPAAEIAGLAGLPYAQAAARIMLPFVGDEVPEAAFRAILADAYGGFGHAAVAPLVQIESGLWVAELFHGPTLAFKDIAMQVLARLMDRALGARGARTTVLAATSGDTGSAAIEAFRGRDAIDVFVLHPRGRISEVQRRQMTTARDANVHNIAIEGTFDDCQALIKTIFADSGLRRRLALSAVNSINWARIMAQTVYYFTSAVALGAPARAVSFAVPTGNFGDIFAGYVAARMGLPIQRLVIATNVNDILARTLASGRYEPRGVVATSSPSMDIQISSNFERLIYEAAGRDGERVRDIMAEFATNGAVSLGKGELKAMRALFRAHRIDEAQTERTIRAVHAACGYLADPHTAVGLAAARLEAGPVPMIALATAHPAKFPGAVQRATGVRPALPARLAGLMEAEERYEVLPNDARQVSIFVESRARALAEAHS